MLVQKNEDIWDKLEAETPTQYSSFCFYRDLGITRTFQKALAKAGKKPSTEQAWIRLSRINNWRERVLAYDLYVDKLRRTGAEKEIVEMSKRHVQASLMFQAKALKRLNEIDTDDIPSVALSRMFEMAVKIERLSRGVPDTIQRTETVESETGDDDSVSFDITKLTSAEYESYKALTNKITIKPEGSEQAK